MNDSLARELIAKITNWSAQQLTDERKNLRLLAEHKYDEYQQFSPGMRFIESLALWLEQFKDTRKIEIAYNFVKNKLVFISAAELNHFIHMTYPDFIQPYLIKQVAPELGIENYLIKKIIDSEKFKILKRECLFLGLSDGARIDLFRRFSELKHEQVYPTYSITEEKANELLDELRDDVKDITKEKNNEKYKFVFLIDDFSASGISYMRKEDGEFKGKIHKFYEQLENENSDIKKIFDMDKLKICVVLYVATKKARKRIEETSSELMKKTGIVIDVIVIQELDDSISLTEEDLGSFVDLMKKKFDISIMTKHYKKGKCDKPYLGFDECGLSVVMSHNCPNNSLPIIWHQSESKKIKALFPRLQRYKVPTR